MTAHPYLAAEQQHQEGEETWLGHPSSGPHAWDTVQGTRLPTGSQQLLHPGGDGPGMWATLCKMPGHGDSWDRAGTWGRGRWGWRRPLAQSQPQSWCLTPDPHPHPTLLGVHIQLFVRSFLHQVPVLSSSGGHWDSDHAGSLPAKPISAPVWLECSGSAASRAPQKTWAGATPHCCWDPAVQRC